MKLKSILFLSLLFLIGLLKLIRNFPSIIEDTYSNHFYIANATFLRTLWGKFPFSVGDILYFILIIYSLFWLVKNRNSWKTNWKNNILIISNLVFALYLVFYLLWGMNYYRKPLSEKMTIEKDYSDTDLLIFTKKLIAKTNEVQFQITKNTEDKIIVPYPLETIYKMNLNGYEKLSSEYPFFNYSQLSLKESIFSLPLTYMGFSGYLNPFTNEAQVNSLIPLFQQPATSCHEMAHQIGYASESECNFIGFLASTKNTDLYSKYSGYSFALRYCLANWQIRNPRIYDSLIKMINRGVLKNYEESDAFWNKYQSYIEKGFHLFYDAFLKWNQQKDGMESYSKFINLLVNYHKNKPL